MAGMSDQNGVWQERKCLSFKVFKVQRLKILLHFFLVYLFFLTKIWANNCEFDYEIAILKVIFFIFHFFTNGFRKNFHEWFSEK